MTDTGKPRHAPGKSTQSSTYKPRHAKPETQKPAGR